LRDEILAWRPNRQSLRRDLAASAQAIRKRVVTLRLALASDRAEEHGGPGADRMWLVERKKNLRISAACPTKQHKQQETNAI